LGEGAVIVLVGRLEPRLALGEHRLLHAAQVRGDFVHGDRAALVEVDGVEVLGDALQRLRLVLGERSVVVGV
ncbi:hypothetical protein EY06_15350, partial [Staphylococcus aureus]